MKRYCFTCDLKNDAGLIEEYKTYHETENVWPEITKSIKDSGIISMDIFLSGNRLFMIMMTSDEFSIDRKTEMDQQNPKVQEWETLMWKYQQSIPWAEKGVKWVQMESIFSLQA